LFRLLGGCSLGVVCHEDRRLVFVSLVAELAACIEGVDVDPIVFQQAVVVDGFRVVGYLYRFIVTVVASPVGGVGVRAAGEARDNIEHALQLFEIGFHAPETTAGKHGRLHRFVVCGGQARGEKGNGQNGNSYHGCVLDLSASVFTRSDGNRPDAFAVSAIIPIPARSV